MISVSTGYGNKPPHLAILHNEATQYVSRTALSLERLMVQWPAIGTPITSHF